MEEGNVREEGGGGEGEAGEAAAPQPPRHTASLEEIEAFLWPAGLAHPTPGSRLFLLAEHGPLAAEHSFVACLCAPCKAEARRLAAAGHARAREVLHGALMRREEALDWLCAACAGHCASELHLKGGFRGRTVVAGAAMAEMERQTVRGDAMRAYGMHGQLTDREVDDFLKALPTAKRSAMPLSRARLRKILAPLPRDADGRMDFYEVRRAVDAVRATHVRDLGMAMPRVQDRGGGGESTRKKARGQTSRLARSLAGAVVPDHLAFRVANRLLHQNAHLLTEVGGAPQPGGGGADAMRLNCYLMHQLEPDTETGWRK